MELLAETVATATGLKERKVVIELSGGEDQSFIFVPSSPPAPVTSAPAEKHELITVANSRSKILVIPDYVHSSPTGEASSSPAPPNSLTNLGDAVKSVISSREESLKDPKSAATPTLSTSTQSQSQSLPQVSSTKKESEAKPSAQPPKAITLDSPLSDVEFLQPLMLEILDVQGPIKTVDQFLDIKRTHNFLYSFLKEAGIAANVDDLIERVRSRLPASPSLSSSKVEVNSEKPKEIEKKVETQPSPSPVPKKAEEPLKTRKTEVEEFPIGVIEGLGPDGKGPFITKHAYIYTVGELAEFPVKFPAIYAMLKDTGLMNDLDAYIERAKELIALGQNIANKSSDLTASTLSKSVRPVVLEQSWLRPTPVNSSGKKKAFDVLLKPPFRNDLVSVNAETNLFALEGLDAQEVELLMTYPSKPIKTLGDLANLHNLTTDKEEVFLFQRIPLLEQFILHAKALSTK